MRAPVLVLDIAGNPTDWIEAQEAVLYYAAQKVVWELGHRTQVFRGGYSRTGIQSKIIVRPIIAIAGTRILSHLHHAPLTLGSQNTVLFKRDRYTCAYCGQRLPYKDLSRDHIVPRSKGGQDTWMNCVTACRRCNQQKGNKLVQDFRPLLYVPYVPCRAEQHLLSGRNILADQHEYLAAMLPRHSRLLC